MWTEVDKNDKVIQHFNAREIIPNLDIVDEIVIHAYNNDICDILSMLSQINNKRIRVTLETGITFDKLTPIVKKYIDEYVNVFDNTHKIKREVFEDVCNE